MLFYSFAIRAITKLGRIPGYEDPDPKELGFTTHRDGVARISQVSGGTKIPPAKSNGNSTPNNKPYVS